MLNTTRGISDLLLNSQR